MIHMRLQTFSREIGLPLLQQMSVTRRWLRKAFLLVFLRYHVLNGEIMRRLLEDRHWLCAVCLGIFASTPLLTPKDLIADEPEEGGQQRVMVVELDEDGDGEMPKWWLGIMLKSVEGDLATYLNSSDGILVDSVLPDSPAEKAGIQKGDIIQKAGESEMSGPADLLKVLSGVETLEDGSVPAVMLSVNRHGESVEVSITPAARPENIVAVGEESEAEESDSWTFTMDGDGEDEQVALLLKQLQSGKSAKGAKVFRFGSPAIVGGQAIVEKNINVVATTDKDGERTTVIIKSSGGEKPEITVNRDGEISALSEDELEGLPEEVRESVEQALKAASNAESKKVTLGWRADVDRVALEQAEVYRAMASELAEKAKVDAKRMAAEIRAQAEQVAAQAAEAAKVAVHQVQEAPGEVAELRKLIEELRAEVKELRGKLEKK